MNISNYRHQRTSNSNSFLNVSMPLFRWHSHDMHQFKKKKQLCLHMQFLMIFNNFLKLHVGDYLECGKPPV